MPQVTKAYTLSITVEQFLEACSLTELQEVDLLLDKYIEKKKRPYADNSEEFQEITVNGDEFRSIPVNSGEKFIGLKFKNKITNVEGKFLRYTHPTGKPLTMVVMTDNGEYLAPASEFDPCFPEDRTGGRM